MARFSWPWSRRESFSSWSVSDPAFAAWLRGSDEESEAVNAQSVMGLAAVIRATNVISGTVAGLPLKTYERRGEERVRVDSVFDDPWPGDDGMTQYEWVETLVQHLTIWRKGILWHMSRDMRTGDVSAYKPIQPDLITKIERVNDRKQFTYRDADGTDKVVGSEQITHIPGPSLDTVDGHPLLYGARAVFSGAISGDRAAQRIQRLGIRLAGLLVPEEGEEVDGPEAEAILDKLRGSVLGRENAGDIAVINRRMKLHPWAPTAIESQWIESRNYWLGEAGRIFGVPPHMLNDTAKQTSWGAGVAEQTLNFARFTLRHYTDRIQARLSQRLPPGQFAEFDYAGLLEGTPEQEIKLLLAQTGKPFLLVEEARRIRNLRPLTSAERASLDAPAPAVPADNFAARNQDALIAAATREQPAPVFHNTVTVPERTVTVEAPDVRAEFTSPAPVVNVTTPEVTVTTPAPIVNVTAPAVSVEAPTVNVTVPDQPAPVVNFAVPEQRPTKKRVVREGGQITEIIEEPADG